MLIARQRKEHQTIYDGPQFLCDEPLCTWWTESLIYLIHSRLLFVFLILFLHPFLIILVFTAAALLAEPSALHLTAHIVCVRKKNNILGFCIQSQVTYQREWMVFHCCDL